MNLLTIPRCFRSVLWLTMLACGGLVFQNAASGATITVTTASDTESLMGTTLRQAITMANKNITADVIVFDIPAGKDRIIDLNSALPALSSNVSIINNGSAVTVQRSTALRTPSFPIFTINPGFTVVIEGLVIARGVGAGVRNNSSNLTMRNCHLHHNWSFNGGGGAIDNYADENGPATLTLTNCTLSENKTSRAGLYFYNAGGGAIRNLGDAASASATLVDCVLRQNFTFYEPPPDGTGGLPIWETPPGGALANIGWHGGLATMSLTRCTLEDNYTPLGGGAIYNNRFAADGSGGGASLTLIDCTLRNNKGSSGGAVYSNTTTDDAATLTLERCTLSGNQASYSGGAISNRGELAVTNCTFSANLAGLSAGAGDGGGAAIYNGHGNGVGILSVLNCTFAENRNQNEARAASIFNGPNGTVLTANSIFVRTMIGDANFVNQGTFSSRGHNLSNDSAGGFGGTAPGGLLNQLGDKRNTDPVLLGLAYNGGFTNTYAIGSTSPAINAGDDALAPSTDQRRFQRWGVSDIGAYERAQ